MLIGSHVGMSGKEMFLGSVKEAVSYGADTFMVYTGAPQNTVRKPVSELNIPAGLQFMKENGIETFIVHAPYIINLANTVKPDIFDLAVDTLRSEIERTAAMGSKVLVLHPGSHVGAGSDAGIAKIAEGLNAVLTPDTPVYVALETMAGKGSEVGRSFEELAAIMDGVVCRDKLRVCFDTCHVNDAGYDLRDYDRVMDEFDRVIGKDMIAAFHINDSKNERGASKDRHANLGYGTIGFEILRNICLDPFFESVPKILESPYIPYIPEGEKKAQASFAPFRYEIEMIRSGVFLEDLPQRVLRDAFAK